MGEVQPHLALLSSYIAWLQCSLYLNSFLKSRVDIFPDEIEFGLHILDVCCGHYYGILFRNDKDVLTVCTVCPE